MSTVGTAQGKGDEKSSTDTEATAAHFYVAPYRKQLHSRILNAK